MVDSDMRQNAVQGVLYLEAMCGERLDEVPVGKRDQWTTTIRDLFSDLGVDLDNSQEANAAFIGARTAVATLMQQDKSSGKSTAHLLRYLMDKSEGYQDSSRRRKFRVWLGEKILPK